MSSLRGNDQDRGRLAASDVPALALGGVKRRKQPRRHRAVGRFIGVEHRRPHALAGHDVRLTGDLVADGVPSEWDRARARVRGDPSSRIDDRDLTPGRSGVVGDQLRERVRGCETCLEQLERARPIGDLDVRLGGDSADPGPRPRNNRADRKPVRVDRHAEFARASVAGDDRIRALTSAARAEGPRSQSRAEYPSRRYLLRRRAAR